MATPPLPQTPAGWYADPTNAYQIRYWDGSVWTTEPSQVVAPVATTMSFVDAVKSALTKYAVFSGRARRSEYWWFGVFTLLAYFVVGLLDAAVGANSILILVAAVGLLLPGLAVTVRRLHDTGHSGWFILISFIPLASVVLLVFECTDSDRGPNRFGSSPK